MQWSDQKLTLYFISGWCIKHHQHIPEYFIKDWGPFPGSVASKEVKNSQVGIFTNFKNVTSFYENDRFEFTAKTIFEHKLAKGTNLNNYFHRHVCPSSVRPSVRHKNFFSLKSPWNHPLTPGVDPRDWPQVAPGHTAPPEELARARRALSSLN